MLEQPGLVLGVYIPLRTTVINGYSIPGTMPGTDPYEPTGPYYECISCCERTTASDHNGFCSSCGGRVRNLAVARE